MTGVKMEKLNINMPVIVEGKYDKIKLSSVINANIIISDGFGIFNEKEKSLLIRRLAEKSKIIVFADSDGAGLVIRNYFNGIIGKDKVIHLYTPQIKGKEKRKKSPSKEGFLGVEGQDTEILYEIFKPFSEQQEYLQKGSISKLDFYADGLSGKENSSIKRQKLSNLMGLPKDISSNALLDAINLLYTKEEYKAFINQLE